MNDFLTSSEIAMIQNDYAQLLESPEACKITIEYYVAMSATELSPTPVTVADVRVIQHHIKPRDLKGMKSQIIEVGDCAFYFHSDQNLEEPISGQVPAPNTLKFIDAAGERWSPVTLDAGDAKRFMTFEIASLQVGQVVFCKLEK
jgi:hypothetical protein